MRYAFSLSLSLIGAEVVKCLTGKGATCCCLFDSILKRAPHLRRWNQVSMKLTKSILVVVVIPVEQYKKNFVSISSSS